ncbi:MAG TPA: helix-turn-helix transcriptional regulator [Solirubrobacteraceae bacterium]|nr:helix-turn-helix transcriptional regulator [Solirubrobacteraceae bacterium]
MTFGRYLCAERQRRGLSQGALAERAGLSRTHVSYIERGIRRPRLETIVLLARGLGLTPAELVGGWWDTEHSTGS